MSVRLVTVTYVAELVVTLPLGEAVAYRERLLGAVRDMLAVHGAWVDDADEQQTFRGLTAECGVRTDAITDALADEVTSGSNGR
jgi:hypothetical protein